MAGIAQADSLEIEKVEPNGKKEASVVLCRQQVWRRLLVEPRSLLRQLWWIGGVLFAFVLTCGSAHAVQVDDLDVDKEWGTAAIVISGNARFETEQLRGDMVTTTRLWYTPWRVRPPFDPVAFKTDLERLQRFYRAQGYYEAQIVHELQTDVSRQLVSVRIDITEGEPVRVTRLVLEVADASASSSVLESWRPELPLTTGSIFAEEPYQETEEKIKERLRDLHYGRAQVTRRATVILERHSAEVRYTAQVGVPTVFGETTIEGTNVVEPALVARSLTYKAGEPFSNTAIDESRKNLRKLDLFSTVRFLEEKSPSTPDVMPMRVKVDEKFFRKWQAGIGYGTEDQVRAQLRWKHNNWFGGGRKLDVQVRVSSLVRTIDLSFLQPYVFGPDTRFSLTLRPQQLDEPGYLLNMTRLQPRLEHDFTRQLTGFVGYRLEYDQLSNVANSTARALAEF
jgi:outer membrane protein assembly factor BamA